LADIPGNTSTTATMTVGSQTTSAIETLGDHDWYKVTLAAGQKITVTVTGAGNLDTYLNIYDPTGTNILASNDDIVTGTNTNSRLAFTAPTAGTYYIDVGSWNDQSTGAYDLFVEPSPPPVWNNDQIAYQLVNGYWGSDVHHFNVTQGGTITVNVSTLTAAEQTLARAALQDWSDVIGVHFQEVTSGGQISFSDAEDTSGNGPIAQTDANWSNGIITSANVQISKSWVTNYGTGLDSYSLQTYIHEIGHALGLGHAGEYNDTANYATGALFANDSWATTVMSYFDQRENSYFAGQGFTQNYVMTPMGADIVAMQELYGLSTTTRTGNTTYGFNTNADNPVYNASLYPNAAYTIFDSGGTDTLDYSGFTANQLINLNPETFSNVGGSVGNVSIARGTIIENAIGGSGNDTIIGNSYANVLTGGAGIDTLTGGGGADTFKDTASGLNGDTVTDFAPGDKIIISNDSLAGFSFSLSGHTLTYTGGSMTLNGTLTGTFAASAASGGGVQLSYNSSAIHHAVADDFNGDGISDILWHNDSGQLTDWLGSSSGGFSPNAANELTSVSTDWYVVGIGDFNGDGRSDILWRNNDGRITDWLGTANGGFTPNAANALAGVSTDWHVAGVGDFNGDGRADILWRNNDGRITDWLGTSTGGFTDNAANALASVSTDWQIAAVGDFNGDGHDDILWRNSDGRITDWLGNGNGGFTPNSANFLNNVSTDWQVAGVGDFNGDGYTDILWRDTDGRITDWLGNSDGGFTPNWANFYESVSTDWQVAQIGDFNGDGKADILWRDSDGRITDWLGTANGGFTDNASHALTGVSTSWHIEPDHLFS
jgi:Ca2+-binding RTX toxin-like protein